MHNSLTWRTIDGFPIALPHSMKAVCLDRSRRGGGRHGVLLIEYLGEKCVIKCFHYKRAKLQCLLNSLGNYLTGRTAFDPFTRFRTENHVLQAWRENGFEVFRQPDDFPPIFVDVPHLIFEYVPGRTLKSYFSDHEISKAEKLLTLKRFMPEWGRRHFLAQKDGNRYLIQVHATFQHVILSAEDGRLIFHDFEVSYTNRHSLPSIIGREIAGYIRSLFGAVPIEDFNDYIDVLIREYPHPAFLYYPFHYLFKHPNRFVRFGYWFDRQRPRNRRQRSKYNMAIRIQDRLQEKSSRD